MSYNATIIISICAFIFSMYQGISIMRRNQNLDNKSTVSELTTVIVKLENIGNGISDIKKELNNVKEDLKDDRERIVKLETYCNLNGMNKRVGGN